MSFNKTNVEISYTLFEKEVKILSIFRDQIGFGSYTVYRIEEKRPAVADFRRSISLIKFAIKNSMERHLHV